MNDFDYAGELFRAGSSTDKSAEPFDYADALLNAPVRSEYTDTAEIDTRTGKPVQKWTPDETPQAGIGALMKSGFVDNPETKIKIFAASRFPDLPEEERLKRYGIRDGKIVFVGNDGKLHKEIHEGLFDKIRALPENAANLPAWALGAAGAAVGGPAAPATATAGGVAGEAIRKGIGALAFDEPVDKSEWALDLALEGLMGATGELGGKMVKGMINWTLAKGAKGIKYHPAIKKDLLNKALTPADHARAEFVKKLAEKHGIDLKPHQLYDRESWSNFWKKFRQDPRTADAVKKFDNALEEQTDDAINAFIHKLTGEEAQDPYTVGVQLKRTAEEAIGGAEAARAKKTKPLYDKARDNAQDVAIGPVEDQVETFIDTSPEGGKSAQAFKKVKKMLRRTTDEGEIPEQRFAVLDNVKKEIDAILEGPEGASIHKDTKRRLVMLKETLVEQMDAASPEYAAARAKHAELSPDIERMERSAIGQLSRLKSDEQIIKATDRLFSSRRTSPQLVEEAKAVLQKRDPRLWDQAVGSYVKNIYEGLRKTEGGQVINAAGKLHKALFNKRQRFILKAALSKEQFENLDGLMTVFKHASAGVGKESMTQQFQIMENELQKSTGGMISGPARRGIKELKSSLVETIFGKRDSHVSDKNIIKLFESLSSPEATKMIKKMKRMRPQSEQLVKSLTTFLTMATGDTAQTGAERNTWEDRPPELFQAH